MSIPAEAVTTQLTRLSAGQRAWFWCAPGHAPCPILLSSLQRDPKMTDLKAQIERLGVSLLSPQVVGLAHVGEDGCLQLGGTDLTEAVLPAIARWAHANITDHPGLARLRGMRAVRTDADGRILERFSDDALWVGLPEPLTPGTLQETAQRLGGLPAGQQGWFWMTDAGPGGRAFLALSATRRDPDGRRFAQRVQLLQRRSPRVGVQLRGLLRRTAAGALVFTTEQPGDGLAILGAVCGAHPPLAVLLVGARVVQLSGGRITQTSAPLPDVSREAALLAALTGDAPLSFWFSSSTGLLLEPDGARLKERVGQLPDRPSGIRGQLEVSRRGWLHLKTRAPGESLLPELIAWVGANRRAWPGLDRLRGARLTQADKTNTPIARHRSDDAWEALYV